MTGPENLISRNEEILVEARRNYYKKASEEKQHAKQLEFGHYLGNITFLYLIYQSPVLVWGFKNYMNLY